MRVHEGHYQHMKRGQSLNEYELNQKPDLINKPYCNKTHNKKDNKYWTVKIKAINKIQKIVAGEWTIKQERAKPSLDSRLWVCYLLQQVLRYRGWRGPRDSAADW